MGLPLRVSPAQEAVTLLVQVARALLVTSEGQRGQAGAVHADNVVAIHNRSEKDEVLIGSDCMTLILML